MDDDGLILFRIPFTAYWVGRDLFTGLFMRYRKVWRGNSFVWKEI